MKNCSVWWQIGFFKQARRLHVTVFILTLRYVLRLALFSCAMREEVSDGRKNREQLIPAFAEPHSRLSKFVRLLFFSPLFQF